MITYVIESSGYYKIGKTQNLPERIRSYETCNPLFKVIVTLDCDCESMLHKKFIDKWHRNEWFSLSKEDVDYIINNKETIEQTAHPDFGVVRPKKVKKDWKEHYKQIRQQARLNDI